MQELNIEELAKQAINEISEEYPRSEEKGPFVIDIQESYEADNKLASLKAALGEVDKVLNKDLEELKKAASKHIKDELSCTQNLAKDLGGFEQVLQDIKQASTSTNMPNEALKESFASKDLELLNPSSQSPSHELNQGPALQEANLDQNKSLDEEITKASKNPEPLVEPLIEPLTKPLPDISKKVTKPSLDPLTNEAKNIQISVEEKQHPAKSLSDEVFLENIRERILVLFEGLRTGLDEEKYNITLTFLEYLLAKLEERLKPHD